MLPQLPGRSVTELLRNRSRLNGRTMRRRIPRIVASCCAIKSAPQAAELTSAVADPFSNNSRRRRFTSPAFSSGNRGGVAPGASMRRPASAIIMRTSSAGALYFSVMLFCDGLHDAGSRRGAFHQKRRLTRLIEPIENPLQLIDGAGGIAAIAHEHQLSLLDLVRDKNAERRRDHGGIRKAELTKRLGFGDGALTGNQVYGAHPAVIQDGRMFEVSQEQMIHSFPRLGYGERACHSATDDENFLILQRQERSGAVALHNGSPVSKSCDETQFHLLLPPAEIQAAPVQRVSDVGGSSACFADATVNQRGHQFPNGLAAEADDLLAIAARRAGEGMMMGHVLAEPLVPRPVRAFSQRRQGSQLQDPELARSGSIGFQEFGMADPDFSIVFGPARVPVVKRDDDIGLTDLGKTYIPNVAFLSRSFLVNPDFKQLLIQQILLLDVGLEILAKLGQQLVCIAFIGKLLVAPAGDHDPNVA